ncbi:MAG: mannose-6-phosphate isomerase [Candidatus Melainabacteria bacterium RIFCSPLOWO2_02_FULL_35_15]|nr:MAG: mannose-6-phosphate isomerase [Candidatus Melainabacteria bacterium RIFCSPLOWO2_12_FULL_35_11]OGI13267.1 MAG: mannose-6-phosphate isomerase [Candidatus Melainabacteria bacterium RIFCSPLOWO2_02_FULL_35_15]
MSKLNELLKLEERPWGGYVILLNEAKYKVKKLIINPKKRFSLQYHNKRNETWTVVKGELKITVDKHEKIYSYGETISVPIGILHRIENIGGDTAEVIEVQTGTYFGEDDIVRLEDDFGRIK